MLSTTAEWCPHCNSETDHDVRIEVLSESPGSENGAYAREPYRISTCERCGAERTLRMNDA